MQPHVFNLTHNILKTWGVRSLLELGRRLVTRSMILLSAILLTNCSYTVSTNIDEDNFTDYFSANKVTIFENLAELQRQSGQSYKSLGLVEGESCQVKKHHAAPSEIDARTSARKLAYKQGATAIIFSGCATINNQMGSHLSLGNQQCISTLVCYGQAYITENKIAESADH